MIAVARGAILAASLLTIGIVFADMEGTEHAKINSDTHARDRERLDLGDLVFLEPLASGEPDEIASALYMLARPSDQPADMERDRRSGALVRVPEGEDPPGLETVRGGSVGGSAAIGISRATHYGAQYEGRPLGCTGEPYRGANPSIAAVGAEVVPCGARMRVTGPAGVAEVVRVDTCPGCGYDLIDLSEAGHAIVCGPGGGTCSVTVERLSE